MKKVLIIFLAVAFTAVTAGQLIDLSGNWELNVSKSKLNNQFSIAPKSCKISQTDSELTLDKKFDFQGQEMTITEKFNLDGSESSNPGIMESVKKSKVEISEDQKSIKITSKVTTNDGGEINSVEQYSIDSDNLTYQITSSSSIFGEMSETAVYDKK